MRLSVQKETNYPKELSYAMLSHGAATGVWSEDEWNQESKGDRASLKSSMQQAAKAARKTAA